ncbi:unnamed protein product [Vicia faba]|uniref:Uncharacterized protein n=1 Tax=Vicia faba TaxID=3906 RepID=A0AAV1APV1_VICFA|nr:unnamed protein product [Vicia faba]
MVTGTTSPLALKTNLRTPRITGESLHIDFYNLCYLHPIGPEEILGPANHITRSPIWFIEKDEKKDNTRPVAPVNYVAMSKEDAAPMLKYWSTQVFTIFCDPQLTIMYQFIFIWEVVLSNGLVM